MSVLQELIELHLRNEDPQFVLRDWVLDRRAEHVSWQEITFQIREKTGRLVTPETLRLWAANWATAGDSPTSKGEITA